MARYTGFDYFLYPDTQRLFGFKGADLYIQTEDGETFYLPDLTADDVGNKIGWKEEPLIPGYGRRFENGSSDFWFKNDSLYSFNLYNYSEPGRTTFLLSRSAKGPFLPMPKTKQELISLFGEPNEWTRYHPPTSP